MTGATPRDPLHARVAGLLEQAFNPIMLKELRGSLRGMRFFLAHLIILCLFAGGLLLAFLAMIPSRPGGYDDPGDPSIVGRRVYMLTQMLQLAVAFLVVPGLAATSISSERESLTHDLLLTTTMTARQIVWGKFTAAMTQAFTIFISMVPLVSLCFLFGGVTVYQIVANYAFLFALSTLMIAYALSMSAGARTTQRAVGSVYGITMLGGLALWALLGMLERSSWLGVVAVTYGFVSPADADLFRSRNPISVIDRILYVHLVPGFVWAAATALFFISATNRLKPLFANRSTPMRAYFAVVLFGTGAIVIAMLYHSLPTTSPAEDRAYAVMGFAIAALTAPLLSALFACEEPFPSLLVDKTPAPSPGWRRLFGLFQPGSDSGAAFTLVVMGVFLAAAFGILRPYVQGFDKGAWTGYRSWAPLATALLMILCWAWFAAMFARFLAALVPERPMLLRAILVLACLFLALFPLIHWWIAREIDRDPTDPMRRRGPITLVVSPVMAVLSSLDVQAGRRDFPLKAGPLPVPAGFALFAIAAGAIFLKLGTRAKATLRREMASEPGTKVSARAPA